MRRTAIDEAISTARGKTLPGVRRAFVGRASAPVECDEASGNVTWQHQDGIRPYEHP